MNWLLVTGRVAADPVMRTGRKMGKQFCKMRFCITGDYRGQNLERETDFVDVLAFGDRGQTMFKHMRKGMRVLLIGSLKTYVRVDVYGQKISSTYIHMRSYEMIDSHFVKPPIEDLSDNSGNLLIPKEITDSLVKQVNAEDEDMPSGYGERGLDDLL